MLLNTNDLDASDSTYNSARRQLTARGISCNFEMRSNNPRNSEIVRTITVQHLHRSRGFSVSSKRGHTFPEHHSLPGIKFSAISPSKLFSLHLGSADGLTDLTFENGVGSSELKALSVVGATLSGGVLRSIATHHPQLRNVSVVSNSTTFTRIPLRHDAKEQLKIRNPSSAGKGSVSINCCIGRTCQRTETYSSFRV